MSTPITEFMTPMPHTVGHDITLEKAKKMMQEHHCHHLPVLDGGILVGILSSTDLDTVAKLKDWQDIKVEEVMTEEPMVIAPSEDVFQATMLMQQKKIGSLIISATNDSPWGIFTATDALTYLKDKGGF